MPLTFTSISLLLAVFVPCRIGTRLCIAEFSNESVMTMTHPSRLLSEITSENVALVSAVATFVLMTFASLVFRKQDVSSLGENVQLGKSGRSTHPIRHSLSPFLFNGSVRNFTCLLSSNPMLEANQARAGLGLDVYVKKAHRIIGPLPISPSSFRRLIQSRIYRLWVSKFPLHGRVGGCWNC